ncbi:MAG: nitroreductase family protein [Anaerovoracaceae bacterium]
MDLIKCIKERRSIRKFEDKKVPHELLEEIADVAAFAPSWKNTQIVRYLVLEDKEKMAKLATDCVLGFKYNTKTMTYAPALILVTGVSGRSGYEKDGQPTTPKGNGWEMFDAGVATQTFCLTAHEKGLGTVIMGIFDEDKVKEVIEIPEGQQLEAIIAIGYPAVTPDVPPRKKGTDLVSYL